MVDASISFCGETEERANHEYNHMIFMCKTVSVIKTKNRTLNVSHK